MATSIYSHALTNGLGEQIAGVAVKSMTDAYVKTLQGYVGNENALLYEITSAEATGKLRLFLEEVLRSELPMKALLHAEFIWRRVAAPCCPPYPTAFPHCAPRTHSPR